MSSNQRAFNEKSARAYLNNDVDRKVTRMEPPKLSEKAASRTRSKIEVHTEACSDNSRLKQCEGCHRLGLTG